MENEDLFAHLNAAFVVTTSDREISGLRCEGFSNPHSHALRLHDKYLKKYPKLFASSTGKIALPDHLPVVTILSINETAHRVLQALFIVD